MELPRLGLFLIILGIVGIVRFIPEGIGIRKDGNGDALYGFIAGMDVFLASITLAAGVGLRKGKAWAPGTAMFVSGPILATSIGMGCIILPDYLVDLVGMQLDPKELYLTPRLIFYLVSVLFWPYAVLRIRAGTSSESRLPLWSLLSVGALIGILLTAVLYVWINREVPDELTLGIAHLGRQA